MTRDEIWAEISELLERAGSEGNRLEDRRCEELRKMCHQVPVNILELVIEITRQRKWAIHTLYDFHDLVVCKVSKNPPCGVTDPNAGWTWHFGCPYHGFWQSLI